MTPTPGTCEYTIEGNPSGPTLVFIHGWSDDASLWRKQVVVLADDFRCVLVTLPNFGTAAVRAGGFDFPEMVEMLAATVRTAQPRGRVGLITHDWGAYLGYLLEQAYPELIERMAALDVGGHLQPAGVREALMIIAYQWSLVAGWLVGGLIPPAGNSVTRSVAKVIKVPDRQRRNLRSRSNYLYFYYWRNTLLPWKRKNLLSHYHPRCPVLYLYGKRKPLMFHSAKWLKVVQASGGSCEGIADAGHWLMETHPQSVNPKVRSWFSREPDSF